MAQALHAHQAIQMTTGQTHQFIGSLLLVVFSFILARRDLRLIPCGRHLLA